MAGRVLAPVQWWGRRSRKAGNCNTSEGTSGRKGDREAGRREETWGGGREGGMKYSFFSTRIQLHPNHQN